MSFNQFPYLFCIALLQLIIPLIVSFAFTIFGYSYVKTNYDSKFKYPIKPYYFGFVLFIFVGLLVLITGLKIDETNLLMKQVAIAMTEKGNISYFALIFLPKPIFWLVGTISVPLLLLYVDVVRPNHNSEIIKANERKKKLESPELIPYDFKKNIIIQGVSGSGKTVAILNFIEEKIKENQFITILDGKGGLEPFSIYDVVTKLAVKYDRPLYIINQTNPNETHSYNPFLNCNATQIKDMLVNMSDWSEDHYRTQASEYWQAMCQFMIDIDEEINFKTLVKYSTPDFFEKAITDFKKFISKEDFDYYMNVIDTCGNTVNSAKSRFSVIANGVGKKLFSTENTFNITKAYKEKAIVIVLLNKLLYSDFATSVGRLVQDDIKNLVGYLATRPNEIEDFTCVYDEISVYFGDLLVDIVNKSRSLGACNIVAGQTIADMDIINKEARRQLLGNMQAFYILQQADDESAETLAKTIGTKKASEITAKLDNFGKTGDGTSKIVDEFKVNPNELKSLELEIGIWYDKTKINNLPIRTKMKYVDVKELKPYTFTQMSKKGNEE